MKSKSNVKKEEKTYTCLVCHGTGIEYDETCVRCYGCGELCEECSFPPEHCECCTNE